MHLLVFFVLSLTVNGVLAQDGLVSVPVRDTFLLPNSYGGNFSQGFVDTSTPNDPVRKILSMARNATFVAYDAEFSSIIGPSPQVERVAGPLETQFATEAGVYIPQQNLVWFTGAEIDGPGRVVMAVNLTSHEVYEPKLSQPLIIANGGTYFNGTVYVTHWGNSTYAGGIVAIDPLTGETTTVVNSYFGVHFNSPNDVIWAHRRSTHALFFTDNIFGFLLNVTGPYQLPSTVWRFDPQTQFLQAVISRAEIPDPNGIATDPNSTKLYVTDTPVSGLQGRGPGDSTGSPAVYAYDLDETLTPINKRLFAIAREGVPDGIKVDRYGRVWTGEGEGVVVRNPRGKVLGIFNARKLLEDDSLHIANFGFADDRLIILAATQIWAIRLGQTLGWTVSA